MTLNEFIAKYTGKFVEAGGSTNAQNQCVDLANQYISEVLLLPKILWTNAQDFPSKAGNKYQYILSTPTNAPSPGDLVIWKSTDKVGHIAIFVSGDEYTFKSFDENWPTGSPCKIVSHNYTNVLGWLHPESSPMMQIEEAKFSELVTKATKYDEFNKAGYSSVEQVNVKIAELSSKIGDYDRNIILLKQQIEELSKPETPAPETEMGYVEAEQVLSKMLPNGGKKTVRDDGTQEIEISYKLA